MRISGGKLVLFLLLCLVLTLSGCKKSDVPDGDGSSKNENGYENSISSERPHGDGPALGTEDDEQVPSSLPGKDKDESSQGVQSNGSSSSSDNDNSSTHKGESDSPKDTSTISNSSEGNNDASSTPPSNGGSGGSSSTPGRDEDDYGDTASGSQSGGQGGSENSLNVIQAENTTEPTFIAESVDADRGQKRVPLNIRVKNNPGLASIGLSVFFDEPLAVEKIEFNKKIGGQSINSPEGSNPVKLIWISPFEDVQGDWTFATLYFSIPANMPQGRYPIVLTYDPDDIYDLSETGICFETINGAIVVK